MNYKPKQPFNIGQKVYWSYGSSEAMIVRILAIRKSFFGYKYLVSYKVMHYPSGLGDVKAEWTRGRTLTCL